MARKEEKERPRRRGEERRGEERGSPKKSNDLCIPNAATSEDLGGAGGTRWLIGSLDAGFILLPPLSNRSCARQ
jgi:hypothetical protein